MFETKLNIVDAYGLGNANENNEWHLVDVSEEIQYYFEIFAKGLNFPSHSINIALRNKFTKKEIAQIEFIDKNVIKFSESRGDLSTIKDLNEKYELFWRIAEDERSGIIYFEQPVSCEVILKATVYH